MSAIIFQPSRNQEVYNLLTDLWRHLNASLPPIDEVSEEVDKEAILIREMAGKKEPAKSLFREAAFVSRFITPAIHDFLQSRLGVDHDAATNAIISENSIDRKRG